MNDKKEIVFLGTGTSHGVPVVDCMISNYQYCPKGVCKEAKTDPKHSRGRSSIIVNYKRKTIIIDLSQDFREQVLRENIKNIDAVLFTHCHADHIMGTPDIRSYSRLHAHGLPIYGTEETIEAVETTFSYIFDPNTFVGGGIPSLVSHRITEPFTLFDLEIIPIPVIHGSLKGCVGYRIGNFAYIPDVKKIPQKSIELLQNLDLLILDCLRTENPHVTHMILPESLEIVRKLKPKQALFTHMCHGIHYKEDKKYLDNNIDFAYDGLRLEL